MPREDRRVEPIMSEWRGKTKKETSNVGFQGRKEMGIKQRNMKVQVDTLGNRKKRD